MTLIDWCLVISMITNCALGYKLYTTRKIIKDVAVLTSELESLSEVTSSSIKKLKTTGGER